MLLLLMLALYGVLLGGVVAYLKILLSRRSNWPIHEAFAASVMTVAAFAFRDRGEFSWVFEPMLLLVRLPLAFFAGFLWSYVIGRTIRVVWMASDRR